MYTNTNSYTQTCTYIFNPRHACAARVTVLGQCVCVCVCYQFFFHHALQSAQQDIPSASVLWGHLGVWGELAIAIKDSLTHRPSCHPSAGQSSECPLLVCFNVCDLPLFYFSFLLYRYTFFSACIFSKPGARAT